MFSSSKFALSLLLALVLCSCSNIDKTNQNTLTIAHFNDIYEISPPSGNTHSRVAQASTFIKELRKNNSPVITTLGGDYSSPSAIGIAKINGQAIAGEQMVDILNAIGLNFAVLGNHEFDLTQEQFLARLSQAKFQIVASNVTDQDGKLFPNTRPSIVASIPLGKRIIKIGIIGITIDYTLKPYVKYYSDIESAKKQISALGKVDAIIALTHLSLERDQKLVSALPQIDLVLGGHEHDNWLIYRGANLTPIVKADSDLKTLALIKLEFGKSKSKPKISISLQPINNKIVADPLIEEKVHKWQAIAFQGFKENGFNPENVIANLTENLDGRESEIRNNPTNLGKLIVESFIEATKADIALFNSGMVRFDDILPSGPITQYDIIRLIPREDNIVTSNIKGSLIEEILNLGIIKNRGSGAYLQVSGVTRENEQWFINGKVLDPNKEYLVAMNKFVHNFFATKDIELNIKEYGDIRQALIKTFAAKYPVNNL